MALPTLSKTWNLNYVNQYFPAQGSALAFYRKHWFTIKESLKGAGWTVRSSSNGTTAAASDLWATVADVNWNTTGSAHSWIVLRNTALGSNFDICLQFHQGGYSGVNAVPDCFGIYYAPQGYNTNGTTAARPTVAVTGDEITLTAAGTQHTGWPGDVAQVIHVWVSQDLQCTRIITCIADLPMRVIVIDKANTTLSTTQWPIPFVSLYLLATTTASVLTPANTFTAANFKSRFTTTATLTGMYGSSESYNTNLITNGLQVPNDLTLEYPLLPIGLTCNTAPYRGRHGSMFDMWQGVSTVNTGSTYPASGSKDFAHFGCLVMPWSSSAGVVKTR